MYNNFNKRFSTVKDSLQRSKLKECVSQRRNFDDLLYDTYYEEEDDE